MKRGTQQASRQHELDERIARAFDRFPRNGFVPEPLKGMAHVDEALPLGHGQTISQPSTVAMMLGWLAPCEGDRVLDIGSGSGWTTALLSDLVGPDGAVDAVEIVPGLLEFGEENCARAGVTNARFHAAETIYGWRAGAPYDRILVSASADEMPLGLLDQLRVGGTLVIPIKNDIWEITKCDGIGCVERVIHPGFVFVPLVRKES